MKDYKHKYILPVTMAVRRRHIASNAFYGTIFGIVTYLSLYTIGGYPL